MDNIDCTCTVRDPKPTRRSMFCQRKSDIVFKNFKYKSQNTHPNPNAGRSNISDDIFLDNQDFKGRLPVQNFALSTGAD